MASPVSGGLFNGWGECETCGKQWTQKNAMGLAAQHAGRFPSHDIHVEVIHGYSWGPDAERRMAERGSRKEAPIP